MPTRAQLRRFAASVLLVWLFGLGSGVVNACVVASGLRHAAHAAALGPAPDHAAHAGPAAAAQHDHEGHEDQPPCERLCDEPVAPAQADKQHASPLTGFWLAAAPLASLPRWHAIPTRAPLPPPEPSPRAAVPIPIAYLRLAL
jgi:hypothetical protein